MNDALRNVAFYLPQFYPTPENDEWWGRGFTEWTNVTKARPRFAGHYQPHLPADLGYCDLRVPEVRAAQADLARSHGLSGFCYHHYWLGGQRLLERPFAEVLASGEPDFPMMLCWSNHDWTRAWDGANGQVLARQTYSSEDDLTHIRWLCDAFSDDRYITINGRPVFMVLQAHLLPDAKATTDLWRNEASRLGIGELYLIRNELAGSSDIAPEAEGFDAASEFAPIGLRRPPRLRRHPWLPSALDKYRRSKATSDRIFTYTELVDVALSSTQPSWKQYRCVAPMWDNSPRRDKTAIIFHDASPEEYARWLQGVAEQFTPYSPDENLLFVNAWNEWGEGAHLEPDQRWGRRFLEAHQATWHPGA